MISDDSRFGLKPICCKRITASGVAPVALQQWRFEWRWLYGLVNPLSGESFFWEYSGLDQRCFEHVLAQLAQQYLDERHVLQMDQSAVHRAKTLAIPASVTLCFQPLMRASLRSLMQREAIIEVLTDAALVFQIA